jgi:hypothetical protein
MEQKKKISLNNLPSWSRWPEYLLGLASWPSVSRTSEKVDQEYDKEKYARGLEYCMSESDPSYEDAMLHMTSDKTNQNVCISVGDDLLKVTRDEAVYQHKKLLERTLSDEIEKYSTIVEMGCGYGYNLGCLNLEFPHQRFIGCEYSRNAVDMAKLLFKKQPAIDVRLFDFNNKDTYRFLSDLESPVLVFTMHALEQLPESSHVFDFLSQYKDSIGCVFHFEPIYEFYCETLLGLMRQRYVEINDYNRDLYSEIKRRRDIRIVEVGKNVFGLNPLLPYSIIRWEFIS